LPNLIAPMWHSVPDDIGSRLEYCLAEACERTGAKRPVPVFFRADDVAVPGGRFAELMETFSLHRMPLCPAVVPVWLTEARWHRLQETGRRTPELWCWHQHGWRHVDHEQKGKKQEFGPGRLPAQIRSDLERGRRRLEELMGEDFYPVFTPPWNRCSLETLKQLIRLDYRAVSRSRASLPPAPPGLFDFQVNVDLHTLRAPDPAEGWRRFLADLQQAVVDGGCGIMIHHGRMNRAAFGFLDVLLKTVAAQKMLRPVNFRGLAY